MNEGVKIIAERLRSDVSGVAAREHAWRKLIYMVAADTDDVYTEEEKKLIKDAAKEYDRAKLTADVMELISQPPPGSFTVTERLGSVGVNGGIVAQTYQTQSYPSEDYFQGSRTLTATINNKNVP